MILYAIFNLLGVPTPDPNAAFLLVSLMQRDAGAQANTFVLKYGEATCNNF